MKRGEDVAENKNLNIIYHVSTPFISFPCDFDVSILSSGVEDIEIVFSQDGAEKFTKRGDQVEVCVELNSIITSLSRNDTSKLKSRLETTMQIFIHMEDGAVIPSNIMVANTGYILERR